MLVISEEVVVWALIIEVGTRDVVVEMVVEMAAYTAFELFPEAP